MDWLGHYKRLCRSLEKIKVSAKPSQVLLLKIHRKIIEKNLNGKILFESLKWTGKKDLESLLNLGDIIFVEFPEVGKEISSGDIFGEIELIHLGAVA